MRMLNNSKQSSGISHKLAYQRYDSMIDVNIRIAFSKHKRFVSFHEYLDLVFDTHTTKRPKLDNVVSLVSSRDKTEEPEYETKTMSFDALIPYLRNSVLPTTKKEIINIFQRSYLQIKLTFISVFLLEITFSIGDRETDQIGV